MNWVIRQAGPEDAGSIAAMMRRLWPSEDPHAFDEDLEALQAHPCERAPMAILVAETGAGCVGFVSLGTRDWAEGVEISPVGYVEGWFVEAAWRRQGVGQALLAAGEQWARQQGFAAIASDTWAHNIESIQGHLRAGYRETERIVHFVKEF